MKKFVLLLVLLVSTTLIFAQPGKQKKPAKTIYTCSMHPNVISSKPGKCSKCGMKLVKQKATMYACPMHPAQKSNVAANCTICGMKMEKKMKG